MHGGRYDDIEIGNLALTVLEMESRDKSQAHMPFFALQAFA